MENFNSIEKLLLEILPDQGGSFPLSNTNIKKFHYFVDSIKNEGLEYWFPKDVITNWLDKNPKKTNYGINDFLNIIIPEDMTKRKKAEEARIAKLQAA